MAKSLARIAESYRVPAGKKFRIARCDPGDTGGLDISKKKANALLADGVEKLADLQTRLYAQDRWSLLLVFQAMDAAGKDSTIKHVMSGINPQGCQVFSFKAPTSEDDIERARLALLDGLEVDLDAAAVGGDVRSVDPDERGEARNGRILQDDLGQRLLEVGLVGAVGRAARRRGRDARRRRAGIPRP